jgi:hypothetical protein
MRSTVGTFVRADIFHIAANRMDNVCHTLVARPCRGRLRSARRTPAV